MSLPKSVAAAIAKARDEYLATLCKSARPGAEWFNTCEYAESEGMDRRAVSLRLNKMHAAGFIEREKIGKVVWWRVAK